MSIIDPYTQPKPWGFFRRYVLNESVTVKILSINQGEEFSLQDHQKREEFWVVVAGTPNVTIGEIVTDAKAGDEFTVPVGTAHRIAAPNDAVMILEIATGEFDEGDIERLEDKYGRA